MRVESNLKPPAFEIEVENDKAMVRLNANILEETREGEEGTETVFVYDSYEIEVLNRPGLEDSISQDFDVWVQMAKAKEDEPAPETDTEKIARLESENSRLEGENVNNMLAIIELYEMLLG